MPIEKSKLRENHLVSWGRVTEIAEMQLIGYWNAWYTGDQYRNI